jgi:exodeoxyribonuclease (lambda-induced)
MEDIILENTIEQGTEDWFKQRLGKITASRFSVLLTQPRSKADREKGLLAKTTRTYLLQKISEVLTGTSKELKTEALTWGSETEDEARRFYELENMVEVEQVGFIPWKENPVVGGSPDGLVGDDGMVEFKCPDSETFTKYLFDEPIPKEYRVQMLGNLMITDRKWCDFVMYDPRVKNEKLRMITTRFVRSAVEIEVLKEAIDRVLSVYEAMLMRVGLTLKDVLDDKH